MNKYFVKLQQAEIESCQTSAQLLVYMSIKSYCGNGKLQTGISIRDISKRCKYSVGWIKPIIEQLKLLNLVFIHGTETRRGGTVEVFSVGTVDTNESVPSVIDSVPPVASSVPPLGTKAGNLKHKTEANKNGIFLTQHNIWGVANKYGVDISDVLKTYYDVLDDENRKKYAIKNSKRTLDNWVKRAIGKGTIQSTSEFASLEMLKAEEPKGENANLLVKPK